MLSTPNAGAADHLELRGAGEEPLGDLGRRAHRKPVIVGNALLELGGRQPGQEVDVDPAGGKDLAGTRAQLIGNQHLCHYAAFAAWRSSSQAQSSQGISIATSVGSTVAPVQIRIPGGEARWLAMS